MVNFGLNSASILGIFLAVAGAASYFMRSVRPELSRDHDIFFAAVGLLCGFILLFQGWRLDPILQFGQFLLTGSAIFFAVESIRLRSVATEQARRNTPIVDRDRPVSKTRVYRESDYDREYDRIEPYDDEEPNYDNPRLRGYTEPKTSRRNGYDSEEPRSSRTRSRSNRDDMRTRNSSETESDNYNYSSSRGESRNTRLSKDRSSSRNPRETSRTTSRRGMNPEDLGSSYEDWDEDNAAWDDEDNNYSQERPSRRPAETATKSSKNRRQRPSEFDRDDDSADYVDYQPIDDRYDEPPVDRDDYPESDPMRDRDNDSDY